jgi:beta-glucosidase
MYLGSGCVTRRSAEMRYTFPDGFLWGAATSGMQHEGSILADGAGESAMRRWATSATDAKKPAEPSWMTPPLHTLDDTADFYRRYESDVAVMREMGLSIYSFEVTWPRIMPNGAGALNEVGLAFYDRLVDLFLEAGIAPLCNLYVFDHPACLEDAGGWRERDMADHFANYATVLFERLGDRVAYWSTICEIPLVGFFTSGTIGGHKLNASYALRTTHHVLLGQGRAVEAFRASGASGQIGNQHVVSILKPASDDDRDLAAARRAHASSNLLYLDPQMRGSYPAELIKSYGDAWPDDAIRDEDLSTISAPIDYFGLDYGVVGAVEHDPSPDAGPLAFRSIDPVSASQQKEAVGDGAYEALRWIDDTYGLPVMILEFGCPVDAGVVDGRVDDHERTSYFHDYLAGVHRAIADGVDVRGAIVWSFLDGWEFGYGLSLRYGLVHVDFDTQERVVKDSARWLTTTIAANGFD